MLFQLLDEKLVGFTSGNVEGNKVVVDGVKSVGDPFQMVVGVLDLSFDPFSVGGGVLSDVSVSVGNSLEIGDGLGTIDLLLFPSSVMFFLFLID